MSAASQDEPPAATAATNQGHVAAPLYGDTTGYLWSVWSSTLGVADEAATAVCEEDVQKLFNALDLFPSKSQVFEMLHCSRRPLVDKKDKDSALSTNAPSAHDYLTFGEFCLFATELKRKYEQEEKRKSSEGPPPTPPAAPPPASASAPTAASSSSSSSAASSGSEGSLNHKTSTRSQKSSSTTSAYDVFLGGSCNPTTWRQDVAIPYLKEHNITYYNPQCPNWVPEMIELEHQAKQTSKVLLYVLSNQTRNVVTMMEIAYLAGCSADRGHKLVVVLEHYPESGVTVNMGEALSSTELDNLESGVITVHDLIERQDIPVFDNLENALKCTVKLIQENMTADQLTLMDSAQPVRHATLMVGDKMLRMRKAFAQYSSCSQAGISLPDLKMAFRVYTNKEMSQKDAKAIVKAHGHGDSDSVSDAVDQIKLDFNAFCCIVAEFFKPGQFRGAIAAASATGKSSSTKSQQPPTKRRALFSISKSLGQARDKCKALFSTSSSSSTAAGGNDSSKQSSLKLVPSRRQSSRTQQRQSSFRDVYLGGSGVGGGGADWREMDAIPVLKKHGLTFFRPPQSKATPSSSSKSADDQVAGQDLVSSRSCRRRLMPIEVSDMDNSLVLLFVIDSGSRSLSSLIEAAYHIGIRRNNCPASNERPGIVLLCVQKIQQDGSMEDGEVLEAQALKDYNRGRAYLSDFANRDQVPVFEKINEAVECVVQKCKTERQKVQLLK